jgi:SAM-dependent methyltransferase
MYNPEERPISPKREQYDTISREYADLVTADPAKRFVQYPSALRLLGDVSGKTVLDVGSGSGIFDRELSRRGAVVTGYDVSSEQVALARQAEQPETSDIRYVVSSPQEFRTEQPFDKAVSVLVLHYAPDVKYLEAFFSSTEQALRDGGTFVSILVNPEFRRFGEILYNRRFIKLGNGRMKADFFGGDGAIRFSVEFSDFSTDDYERAAADGGFARSEWIPLKVEDEGRKELGEEFWRDFEEDSPFVGFIAYKK